MRWDVEPRVDTLADEPYYPGGGYVQIPRRSVQWNARSQVRSMANMYHRPGGGNITIVNERLKWRAAPMIDTRGPRSPPRPAKPIFREKLNWKTQAKVSTWDNAHYRPDGGHVTIYNERPKWKAASKVGSWDNADHKPPGGRVKIITDQKAWYSGELRKKPHVKGHGSTEIYHGAPSSRIPQWNRHYTRRLPPIEGSPATVDANRFRGDAVISSREFPVQGEVGDDSTPRPRSRDLNKRFLVVHSTHVAAEDPSTRLSHHKEHRRPADRSQRRTDSQRPSGDEDHHWQSHHNRALPDGQMQAERLEIHGDSVDANGTTSEKLLFSKPKRHTRKRSTDIAPQSRSPESTGANEPNPYRPDEIYQGYYQDRAGYGANELHVQSDAALIPVGTPAFM